MRVLLCGLVVLMTACSASAATPAPTEDPRVAQLTFANAALQEQVVATEARSARLTAENNDLTEGLSKVQCCGTFAMWQTSMTAPAGNYAVIGMPDTFTVHIRFTTDHPVKAWVMDLSQLVAVVDGRPFTAAITFGTVTKVDAVFHDSEGCAAYVLVILPSEKTAITGDTWITRHLSPPSGSCAN